MLCITIHVSVAVLDSAYHNTEDSKPLMRREDM
jgi:hypothetical protein